MPPIIVVYVFKPKPDLKSYFAPRDLGVWERLEESRAYLVKPSHETPPLDFTRNIKAVFVMSLIHSVTGFGPGLDLVDLDPEALCDRFWEFQIIETEGWIWDSLTSAMRARKALPGRIANPKIEAFFERMEDLPD